MNRNFEIVGHLCAMWKTLIIISVLAIAVFLVIWAADGGEVYTKTSVEVTVIDPLFETETKEWKEQFVLGLLPSGSDPLEMMGVASLCAPFVLIILLSLWQLKRAQRRTAA